MRPAGEASERAAAFRRLADGLARQVEEKSRPAFEGMRPTWRRENIRSSKAEDARQLRHLQATLYALADAWDRDAVPDELRGLRTKMQVELLVAGYYHEGWVVWEALEKALAAAGGKKGMTAIRPTIEGILRRVDRSEWRVRLYGQDEVDAVDALKKLAGEQWAGRVRGYEDYRALLKAGISSEEEFQVAHTALETLGNPALRRESQTEKWQRLEREVLLANIPGFFPSPPPVVARILREAGLAAGQRVLEPSAGSGALADAARQAGTSVECFEVSCNLRELLTLKGHQVIGPDFTEADPEPVYDRVLMNPPFEHSQDIEHVRRAYDWLKPGGRLVSIMGEGAFFRIDQKAQSFRAWLDEVGGWSDRLPDGSFELSGTGVATRIVVIDK